MTGLESVVVPLVVAVVAAAGSWAAARTTARAQENQAVGPDWNAFVERIQEENMSTKRELTARIDALSAEVAELRRKVGHVQDQYRAALRYGRAWRLLHPESVGRVEVPAIIENDL